MHAGNAMVTPEIRHRCRCGVPRHNVRGIGGEFLASPLRICRAFLLRNPPDMHHDMGTIFEYTRTCIIRIAAPALLRTQRRCNGDHERDLP